MTTSQTTQHFDCVKIALHPFDYGTLKDATWHPYPVGAEHYNTTGNNGYLIGTVVKGATVSHLFGVTRQKEWPVGETRRFDFLPITRVRTDSDGVPMFVTATCG